MKWVKAYQQAQMPIVGVQIVVHNPLASQLNTLFIEHQGLTSSCDWCVILCLIWVLYRVVGWYYDTA